MGNYKEGEVSFILRKDTPFSVIESIVDMFTFITDYDGSYKTDRNKRIEKLRQRKEKFFQSEILENLYLEIDPIMDWSQEEKNIRVPLYTYLTRKYKNDMTVYYDLNSLINSGNSNLYTITKVKELLKRREFNSLFITCRVCNKRYRKEFDDLVDYLRPYLIDNHPNIVGHIQDEDGYLNKDIYIDNSEWDIKVELRKSFCEKMNCDRYETNCECDNWKYCVRAFSWGVGKKMDKETTEKLLKFRKD